MENQRNSGSLSKNQQKPTKTNKNPSTFEGAILPLFHWES